MGTAFISPSIIKKGLGEKKEILENLADSITALDFVGPNNLWSWFVDLASDVGKADVEKLFVDTDMLYKFAILEQIDFKKIARIGELVKDIEVYLAGAPESNDRETSPEVRTLVMQLGLEDSATKKLLNKASAVDEDFKDDVVTGLQELARLVGEISPSMTVASAALLYHLPDGFYVDYEAFSAATKKINIWQGAGAMADDACVARYLGQRFFGRDLEMVNWCYGVLTQPNFRPEQIKTVLQSTVFITCLYVTFVHFNDITTDQQEILLARYALWAFSVGVPLETLLENFLMTLEHIIAYIRKSGRYAEVLVTSNEPVVSGGTQVSIKDFLTGFLAVAQTRDQDAEQQRTYAVNAREKFGWPTEVAAAALRLIRLYIDLRECSLADFNGELSEVGRKPRYDWQKALASDMDDAKLDSIKQYLRLIGRPAMNKIRIIAAINTVPWQQEPYLTRVLALSNVYEEVFGPRFGQLVYFDESKGQWDTNLHFPPMEHEYIP